MVDIIIAYYRGTSDILGACLHNLFKYEAGADFNVTIVHDAREGFDFDIGDFHVRVVSCDVPSECDKSISGSHAFMLDEECTKGDGEHVLTLDSDCFPVADDWLGELVDMLVNKEVGCSGILYPWCPPDGIFVKNTHEWRISSQTCWEQTHVACQLVRRRFFDTYNLKYSSGDDTGLGIPLVLFRMGFHMSGWMPSACPIPDDKGFDAELNREVCVMFGDKMYHHGGASRQLRGAFVSMANTFKSSRERVIFERDASFLLNEGYRFSLDREEEVLTYRMKLMQQQMVAFLQQNERLFQESNE